MPEPGALSCRRMPLLPGSPETGGVTEERRREAIRALDAQMARRASSVVQTLKATHPVRLGRWRFELRDDAGTLIRHSPQELARLDLLARHAETARAEAEALLVHEQLGGRILLSETERENLLLRAMGVIPADEGARYNEICAYYDLNPKHIMIDVAHFAAGLKLIEASYGQGTALGYGLLLASGVRSREDMVRYGGMIQELFEVLTTAGPIVQTLLRIAESSLRRAPFDTQFTLLTQLRAERRRLFPAPTGSEFRLTRLLETAVVEASGADPNALGLAALDAVILAKLTFKVRLVWTADGYLGLEIPFDARSVYWDLTGSTSLSHVALVPNGRKAAVYELLPRIYHQIGIWSSRQGQLTHAAGAFNAAVALKPDMPEALNELGQIYLRSNKPDEAVAAGQRAIALDSNYGEAYVTVASGYLTMNRVDEAIDVLKRAVKVRHNLAEAWNNLGFAYQMKGDTIRAVDALLTAIKIRPDYAHAHYNLGNTYVSQEHYEDAVSAYQKALRLNPGHVRALYNLGLAYYQLKKLDAAINAYERVLKINPKHAGALYNLGIIYRDKGMTDKAVEIIEQAVQLNPNLLR